MDFTNGLRSLLLLSLTLPAANIAADSIAGTNGPIEITPLLHSSVQLEYEGMVIQVDPWDRLGLVGAKPADLILATDDVGHHLDPEAIAKLRKPGTPVVITASGKAKLEDGIVIKNGEMIKVAGITVEAVAAYDIIQGEPSHPKGDANGYVVTLGGKRFYFAGVTECVDEVKALENIDVVFFAMNVPLGRMTPAATAECARILKPDLVYPYHYDQVYTRKLRNPDFEGTAQLPDGLSVAQSLERLAEELQGSGIEVKLGEFYPPLD